MFTFRLRGNEVVGLFGIVADTLLEQCRSGYRFGGTSVRILEEPRGDIYVATGFFTFRAGPLGTRDDLWLQHHTYGDDEKGGRF